MTDGQPVYSQSVPQPSADDVSTVQQVQLLWNQGSQLPALELLRPKATEGRPWAAALLAWLLTQQGPAGIDEAITWAVRAAELGLPAQAVHTFNNAVGQVPANPSVGARLPELLQWAIPGAAGIDPIGQGWNLVAQGQPVLGIQLMMTPATLPATSEQWNALSALARSRIGELEALSAAARESGAAIENAVSVAQSEIASAVGDLQTNARQSNLLVQEVSSSATKSLYEQGADRNQRESKGVWRAGLGVLGGAAAAAVAPLVLHYLSVAGVLRDGPHFTTLEQIGVHLASTAALASFAGVLLARARARDRAAQRLRDLATAMGTMITFSNQIDDGNEKQRFIASMGQAILQASLVTSSGQKGSSDESANLLALTNIARTLSVSSPQN